MNLSEQYISGLTNYKTRFLLEALCAIKGVINGEEMHLFMWEGKLNRQNKNVWKQEEYFS